MQSGENNVLIHIVFIAKMAVEEMVLDVSSQNMQMMMFVMMATTMLIAILMEVLAVRKIHLMDGMIGALFVNVKRMMKEEMVSTVCLCPH